MSFSRLAPCSCPSRVLLNLLQLPVFRLSALNYRATPVLTQNIRRRITTRAPPNIQETPPATMKRIGQSGRRYSIERALQEKQHPASGVYLATSGNERFVLKDVPGPIFEQSQNLYLRLGDNPHLRLPQDTVEGRPMFVYKYFSDHLLNLAQRGLPTILTKRILKDTLRGIVVLHDRDIVHTDVKPNNIMVESTDSVNGMVIDQVQLADIEDAAHVPSGSDIVGKQVGNMMWRSPEGHAQGPVNKPSDMFSFGIVCVYAMLKRVIFAVGQEELGEGEQPLAIIIERQISYFADQDGFDAFVRHIDENSPWCQIFGVLRDSFNGENPRRPFSLWKGEGVEDEDFKDLVGGLTNFDPAKRLTARQALAHRWFDGV